jgi:hypothetical protein
MALLPPSTTDLKLSPSYRHCIGPDAVLQLANSPIAANLRRLELSYASIPATHTHTLAMFSSLQCVRTSASLLISKSLILLFAAL